MADLMEKHTQHHRTGVLDTVEEEAEEELSYWLIDIEGEVETGLNDLLLVLRHVEAV
jgi:hypothetical protein